jgi:hypothetical protein
MRSKRYLWLVGVLVAAVPFSFQVVAQTAEPEASDTPRTPPTPEEDAQARVHFQSGQMFFGQARYQEAALAFEEAYRLSQRPELLLNAATSYERMLQFEHALELSRRCVAELALEHPRHQDCEIAVRRLDTMAAHQRTEREAAAQREADAHRAREDAERLARESDQRRQEAEAARSDEPSGLTGLQWVGIGAAGAGVGFTIWGAISGYHARTARNALDTVCPTPSTCPDAPVVDDTIDTMNRRARVATATTIIGGAGIAAGVVLLIVGRRDDEAPAVVPTAGPGDFGLGFAGRF